MNGSYRLNGANVSFNCLGKKKNLNNMFYGNSGIIVLIDVDKQGNNIDHMI